MLALSDENSLAGLLLPWLFYLTGYNRVIPLAWIFKDQSQKASERASERVEKDIADQNIKPGKAKLSLAREI